MLTLQNANFIPVIAPIGVDAKGTTHNINADLVAGSLAAAIQAEKLLMLSDVKGIRDANKQHVSTLSRKDMERMVKKKVINEGMLPKVHACLSALQGGVQKAISSMVAYPMPSCSKFLPTKALEPKLSPNKRQTRFSMYTTNFFHTCLRNESERISLSFVSNGCALRNA